MGHIPYNMTIQKAIFRRDLHHAVFTVIASVPMMPYEDALAAAAGIDEVPDLCFCCAAATNYPKCEILSTTHYFCYEKCPLKPIGDNRPCDMIKNIMLLQEKAKTTEDEEIKAAYLAAISCMARELANAELSDNANELYAVIYPE